MKKITILLFGLLMFGLTYSQKINGLKIYKQNEQYSENDSIPKIINPQKWELEKPIILLNDKYVANEVLNTINPKKIESIKIEKNKVQIDGTEYNGKIIVKTKANYDLSLLKIKDFIEKYARIKNGEYIYFIDGEVLNTDENLMYVDEKNIMQVKVTKLDKTEKSKKLYFVKLLTRTKENLKKGDTIYIRGNELSVNN
ncbi:hypothetical protein CYV15_01715 [Riemerella anatipestifer]|uniref:hypothetical protein n=1 Tax=Riemerella anatipestifer TaxID=34085 RepID=UPI000D141FC1|nr:hypothetical protein [Riemerella anatipestifer]MDD1524003.1 hypothetical protein [Riemerella anatipestifer]PST45244.1 hypothetical protein CYV15_01715 [Riemerella anatipestifer]